MPFLVNAMAAALAAVVQPAPDPSPPAPAPKATVQTNTVAAVVVTGEAVQVQTSIDRRSYSLGKDIQAAGGSIADALRNLPSVQVDLQGQLTLRGDANVTILVDGKPSGAFEGAGRADALQQLPADQIERVEVITNPSAAFDPNGSAGVINLITKKSRGAGSSGSAYVTAGSAGLKRAGLNFGYNSRTLSLTGAVAGAYQRNKSLTLDHRSTPDPVTGLFEDHDIELNGRGLTRSPNGRLNASYALTPKDQLTGGLTYNELLTYGSPFYRYRDGDIGDSDYAAFSRQAQRRFIETDTGVSAGWRRSFAGDGHQLSIDAL